MKTKKVVVGALTAALLSMNSCAIPSAFAAGETVQISAGSTTAEPGGTFSIDISMADIPSTGIQNCDFAVEFDSSVLNVTSVTAGALTDTGADDADESSSFLPLFGSESLNDEGAVELTWTTMLDDSNYWLQGSGVFCTINGTVADTAEAGSSIPVKVTAVNRETYPGSGVTNDQIFAGYLDGTNFVPYKVSAVDGEVKIGGENEGLRGDANCSGKVDLDDVIAILLYSVDSNSNPLTDQGFKNADVYQTGDGVSVNDATQIQRYLALQIDKL